MIILCKCVFREAKTLKYIRKILSAAIALTLAVSLLPAQPAVSAQSKQQTGAASASDPWPEEISNNAAYAGIVSVPPVIRVANAGYGLDNQAITSTDCTAIQTSVINYSTKAMQPYSTTISITVPAGATAPSLSAAVLGGTGSVIVVVDNFINNPYTWHIAGGNAPAGSYIDYTFTYTLNGKQYIQKAASYVDLVELGAGWQTYVVGKNWWNTEWTRHEYTAVLSGSGSSGLGYSVYGGGGTGYYKMATGGGTTGFVSGAAAYSGMRLWDPGFDGKGYDVIHWYCGQDADASKDDGDGGHRAKLDVYYDPAIITNISQLGIKLLYWRSTSPSDIPTMYQEKMITLSGDVRFSNGSVSNAQNYFYSTNALNNRTQRINTNPGTMVFSFASTALPPDGQKVTFASGIYGKKNVDVTSWDAWTITFHVMQKSALRDLLNYENNAFRQIHDGYTDTDGSFAAYRTQLAKSMAVLNQPNATQTQINAAVTDLNASIGALKYVPADYNALNAFINSVYNPTAGYRPSPVYDPEYYYFTNDYYPIHYYESTDAPDSVLAGIVYGLDKRYQSYVDNCIADLDTAWQDIVLKYADYTEVDGYFGKAEGVNDFSGSVAGNYILAYAGKYPQYEGDMLYWRNYTDDSFAIWESVVIETPLGLKLPDQLNVDNAADALREAYEGLTLKNADYAELDAVRAQAQAVIDTVEPVLNPAGAGYPIYYYDNTSVNALIAKLSEIEDDLYMPEQGRVYIWADELQTILDGKTVNNADYTFANAQKNTKAPYEDNYTYYYTTQSWQALVSARNAVIPGKKANEQATVNTWAKNIYDARNALVIYAADYAAVDAAMASVNALNPAYYKNWQTVLSAVENVAYGLDITHQDEVNGYAAAIYTAVNGLIYADADLTALNNALSAAAALNENLYTPESWAAVESAVAAGEGIVNAAPPYDLTRQYEVNAAATAISNAINALDYKGADYTQVIAAVNAANALEESDYKNWYTVQAAVDAVVYGLERDAQATVDGYASAIIAAMEGLVYIDANLTGLVAALNAAAGVDANLYTTSSYSALQSAVSAAVAIRDADPAYDKTRQSEVDAAASAVTNAVAALVFLPADYSQVDAAIAQINALDSSVYSNWAVVEQAVNAVVFGLDITQQETVDGYAAALSAALAALDEIAADLTGLLAALDAAASINQTLYTPATWDALSAAVTAGTAIRDALPPYNISRQGDVDAAAAAIANAVEGLSYKPADYSRVNAAIAQAEALTEEYYQNWDVVQAALNAVVFGLDITHQATVDGYADAIIAAIGQLIFVNADLSGLIQAISLARSLNPDLYTAESKAVLNDALAAGIAVRDANPPYHISRQAEVDAATNAITQAIAALVYIPADYSGVDAAIAAANALDPAVYANWTDVQMALDAVVRGLNIAQQSTVDGFAAAINLAILNLTIADADLTALRAVIARCEALNVNHYTPQSWSAMINAVIVGYSIIDADPPYTIYRQDEVDTATADIEDALEALVEKTVDLAAAQGSTVVVDGANGLIYGLPADGSLFDLSAQGYINVVGDGHIVCTPGKNGFGTGTKVEVLRNGDNKVMKTYYIVIFGDTDGDGLCDGRDVFTAAMLAAGALSVDDAGWLACLAADADHDGHVTAGDAQLIELAGLMKAEIIQTI